MPIPPPAFKIGDYVTWHTDSDDCYRITSVDAHHITYQCWDDVLESVDADMWRSLEEKTRHWRLATPEQIARFERLFRPAPQNWN